MRRNVNEQRDGELRSKTAACFTREGADNSVDLTAKLTELEVPHLIEDFNLTDGHIHRGWAGREVQVIARVADFFRNYSRENQKELEKEFLTYFHLLSAQSALGGNVRHLLCTSASMSIEIIANFLRQRRMKVGLLEPCFDNIADIFRRHGISLTAISERVLTDPGMLEAGFDKFDVLFLVSPNNPTGLCYDLTTLKRIGEFCRERAILLIIDASFRFYRPPTRMFDEYGLLNEIGTEFIFVEDTGKTWPTHDLKVSILSCNNVDLHEQLQQIRYDFILHVSPFILKLLCELIKCSIEDKLFTVQSLAADNREFLEQQIEGTILCIQSEQHASIAWLGIEGPCDAYSLVKEMGEQGVFVLPGNQFFWNDPERGSQYLRVALTRDRDKFQGAAVQIGIVAKAALTQNRHSADMADIGAGE